MKFSDKDREGTDVTEMTEETENVQSLCGESFRLERIKMKGPIKEKLDKGKKS